MNDSDSSESQLPRLTSTPAGVKLGALDLIADGKARGFVLEMKAGRFHGFIVRKQNNVFGYVDRCPHMAVPLVQKLDEYLTPDGSLVQCAWHGALFRTHDGLCLAGPCTGQVLQAWPVTVQSGMIVTA